MFLTPLKFDKIVVSPPKETKQLANDIFDRILKNYRSNYAAFKANPEPHLKNILKDPWYRREAWRWNPYFSPINVFRKSFPGLGIASLAFSAYLVYDLFIATTDSNLKSKSITEHH